MPNKQVGKTPVQRRTLCFDKSDWEAFNNLIAQKCYDLNGISSLFRLFLRLSEKYQNKDLSKVREELVTAGYSPTLDGLLKKLTAENDRIQPVTKGESISPDINNELENIINQAFEENK